MRLFTFGCSYTNYVWPTWADIIAYDLGCEFYNYGIGGLGNVGISCRIVEADCIYKFHPDDLIIVQWSSWSREDRYIKGKWAAHGNVWNNDFYDRNFLLKYVDTDNDLIKNSTARILVDKAYGEHITYQHEFPVIEPKPWHATFDKKNLRTWKIYQKRVPELPSIEPVKMYKHLQDTHPTITEYLKFVDETIYPALGRELKNKTKLDMLNLHYTILGINDTDTVDKLWKEKEPNQRKPHRIFKRFT